MEAKEVFILRIILDVLTLTILMLGFRGAYYLEGEAVMGLILIILIF